MLVFAASVTRKDRLDRRSGEVPEIVNREAARGKAAKSRPDRPSRPRSDPVAIAASSEAPMEEMRNDACPWQIAPYTLPVSGLRLSYEHDD